MIEVSQLVSPLLLVVMLFKLLKYCYPLLEADFLSFIKLVLKDISASIPWCNPYEFLVILHSLNKLTHLDGKLAQ